MPGLSLAKTAPFSRLDLSADQTEAVRRLVGHTIAEVECELIVETLKDQCGSRTASAKLLGISLRTLRNKNTAHVEKSFPSIGRLRCTVASASSDARRRWCLNGHPSDCGA